MKQTFFLFLIALTCMANQCGKERCEERPICESITLGTLKLDPASAAAVPFQGNETVTFINQQGFQAQFKASGYTIDSTETYVTQTIFGNCRACTEHFFKERSSLTFTGTNINFSFTYDRIKNVMEETRGGQAPDPTGAGDVLKITLAQREFAVPLTTAPIEINTLSQFRLRDSVVLGPKTFFQVYEVTVPDNNSNWITPKSIFYSKQQGLVGYYLTNNELWYKQ